MEEVAEKSLMEWSTAVEPWLTDTRDPVKFADIAKCGSIGAPDPYQAFYAFRAGRLEEARAILEAMCQGEKRTYEEWRRELKGTLIIPKTWPKEPDPGEIESRMRRDRTEAIELDILLINSASTSGLEFSGRVSFR